MIFIRSEGDSFLFRLGRREKRLFLEVLRHYPLMPEDHPRVSRHREASEVLEQQRLLEESLAEQRRENRRSLESLLNDKSRMKDTLAASELRLCRGEIEWLLQILNDVRVGSWLRLGSPDERKNLPVASDPGSARLQVLMDLSMFFQACFLKALQNDS